MHPTLTLEIGLFFDLIRVSSYIINVVRTARAVARWVRRRLKRVGLPPHPSRSALSAQ